MENKQENLVKKTCRELGINQKELAEKIGVSDGTVRNWSSKGEIPINITKHFNLLVKYQNETQFKKKFKELITML